MCQPFIVRLHHPVHGVAVTATHNFRGERALGKPAPASFESLGAEVARVLKVATEAAREIRASAHGEIERARLDARRSAEAAVAEARKEAEELAAAAERDRTLSEEQLDAARRHLE